MNQSGDLRTLRSVTNQSSDLHRLRGAVYRRNGPAVVAASVVGSRVELLQLARDGALVALAQRVPGATDLARRVAGGLRHRGWVGDSELADQLDAARGYGPWPVLRPLPVDLDQLADLLEGDPTHGGGGYVDVSTGEVLPQMLFEETPHILGSTPREVDEQPRRWLQVQHAGSGGAYRDMSEFAATVGDPGRAERLQTALGGRRPFQRMYRRPRWPVTDLLRYRPHLRRHRPLIVPLRTPGIVPRCSAPVL